MKIKALFLCSAFLLPLSFIKSWKISIIVGRNPIATFSIMLKHLLSILSEAVIAFDIDEQKVLMVNRAVEVTTGYPIVEFEKGIDLLNKIIHPDDKSKVEDQKKQAALAGEVELFYRIMTPRNQIKWIHEKLTVFVDDESGHHIRLHILTDITESFNRPDTEQKVWFLSSLVNAIGALVFRINIKGEYTFVNDIYTRQLGYRKEELLNQPMSAFLFKDDIEMFTSTIAACLDHPGEVFHIRHRKVTSDGRIRWIATDAVAVRDRQGKVTEIQGVALDISDLQVAREEVLWTKNNLEALINNTEDLIWAIDSAKLYTAINTSFCDRMKTHYHVDPQIGLPVFEGDGKIYGTDKVAYWDHYYEQALQGKQFVINYEVNHGSGERKTVFEITINPIFSTNNAIIGVGCFAHDVTDSLIKQKAIERQNEKLKRIASLSSHELRRPVSSLLGLVPLIDTDNYANPDNQVIISHIATVTKELDHVITNIIANTFVE